MLNVAINGFGRIGRCAFKIALENRAKFKIVAINDLTDAKTLAYLLRYDTVYGRWNHQIDSTEKEIIVDGIKYPIYAEKDPSILPWGKLGVDVVIESTGFFTDKKGCELHLKAGAKRVVISAPPKGDDIPIYVLGVNDQKMKNEAIISNASCTTNCSSPVMKVLNDKFGIKKALLDTIHAYTATQKLIDGPDAKDPRRGRCAAENMGPSTTGAAIATAKTIPEIKGLFDGMSVRVPVVCGSICDITAVLKKKTTVKEINQAFIAASKTKALKDILAVSDDSIVSRDIIGTSYSAIVDLPSTMVVDGDLVKVIAWYDNEWGYSNRLVEITEKLGNNK